MNDKNNILLISDDNALSKALAAKLIFLRKNDEVIISDYKSAIKNIKKETPDIVLIHENISDKATIDLITEIHKNELISIILLVNSYNQDLILAAYDSGISDFILTSAADFELVIRTVANMKYNSLKLSFQRNRKIMEQLNIIDDLTGLYNYKFAQQAIENVIDDDLLDDGIFMTIGTSEESKQSFSVEKMAESILNSLRVNDIATLGRGAKFYILLPKTDCNGAIVVLNKIKELYGNEICAGITEIAHKNFVQMEHDALQAFSEAFSKNSEYVITEEKDDDTLDEWLEGDANEAKNYKIFRKIFNKKMEKVITPVFFRLQKTYEDKLFDTKIEQYTDEEQCVFHLQNKNQDSILRIVYPGFAKILITITHEGLDSPENKEIQLPLNQITQKELVAIVENFIKDFKYTSA